MSMCVFYIHVHCIWVTVVLAYGMSIVCYLITHVVKRPDKFPVSFQTILFKVFLILYFCYFFTGWYAVMIYEEDLIWQKLSAVTYCDTLPYIKQHYRQSYTSRDIVKTDCIKIHYIFIVLLKYIKLYCLKKLMNNTWKVDFVSTCMSNTLAMHEHTCISLLELYDYCIPLFPSYHFFLSSNLSQWTIS